MEEDDVIRIGIIGMSQGNAHPYSWSAIINGTFDGEEISRIGYPAVTAYLEANADTIGISQAKVTHVWTQSRKISESIARSTNIPHLSQSLEEMATQVDAVILARDDPEQHVQMSRPFMEGNVPLFIDKPLAFTTKDLNWYRDQHMAGKLFMSCSSMRYAHEIRTAKTTLNSLGKVHLVTAVGKKDWPKYGVHLLEAIFALLDDPLAVSVRHSGTSGKDVVQVLLNDDVQVTLHLFKGISGTFQLSVFGEVSWQLIEIQNSYAMFRDNIGEFIRSVKCGSSRLNFEKTENIISTLIGAHESLLQHGEIVYL